MASPTICMVHSLRCNRVLIRHRRTVLRLTLPDNEKYVVDLTAASFGWKETLAPWNTWIKLRTVGKMEIIAYPHLERTMVSLVRSGDIEYNQQCLREMLLGKIDKKMDLMSRATFGQYSVRGVLTSSDKDFKRLESEIIMIVKQSKRELEKEILRKDDARLFLGPAPNYRVRVATPNYANIVKDVWLTKAEYDKLKSEGADMKKIWDERMGDKAKQVGCCSTWKRKV